MSKNPRSKKIQTAAVILMIIAAASVLFLILRSGSEHFLVLTDMNTGKKIAEYPIKDNDRFSITFIHSVNKSPLTDIYEIRNGDIYVVETHYHGFGAGVQTEIEEGQTLSYASDGTMIVSGFDKLIPSLSYFVGTVSDHVLKIHGREISLRELCGRNCKVRFSCENKLF